GGWRSIRSNHCLTASTPDRSTSAPSTSRNAPRPRSSKSNAGTRPTSAARMPCSSVGEKENFSSDMVSTSQLVQNQQPAARQYRRGALTLLPVPRGSGRGEGEVHTLLCPHIAIHRRKHQRLRAFLLAHCLIPRRRIGRLFGAPAAMLNDGFCGFIVVC